MDQSSGNAVGRQPFGTQFLCNVRKWPLAERAANRHSSGGAGWPGSDTGAAVALPPITSECRSLVPIVVGSAYASP